MTDSRRYGVLAVIDGYRLTGPARQLLASRRCPNADIALALFQRTQHATPFMAAARQVHVPTYVIPDRFPGDPRTVGTLARLAADSRVDIVQTHGYKANVLAAIIRARVRRPWVAFMHGETWESRRVRFYFALERLAVRRADRIVVMSDVMARALEAQGIARSKLRVIHNACLVDPSSNGDLDPRNGAPPVIGVVGRLSYEKGVDVALEIHRRVTQQREARLCVLGEGPEQVPLMRLAQRLGISASVDWLGYREDMAQQYRRMSVVLLPSRSEGLPNVALEAMAHGVPVVATAVGGVPEVVSDGTTGFLAPTGDAETLARRVLTLLADASLRQRFGRAAHKDVTTRFSLQARCQALAGLYAETAA